VEFHGIPGIIGSIEYSEVRSFKKRILLVAESYLETAVPAGVSYTIEVTKYTIIKLLTF
jgi:hypothetical protein